MAALGDARGDLDRLGPELTQQVRLHLQEILASAAFANSKRAAEFLRLVVERSLTEGGDALKERLIGVEMFGRPPDYDTANDAVVRVQATDVRRRLAQFYQELGAEPEVRIDLPVGSYVPRFAWRDSRASESVPSQGRAEEAPAVQATAGPPNAPPVVSSSGSPLRRLRWSLLLLPAALLLAVLGVFFSKRWYAASPLPQIRSIAILPLLNLSGDPKQEYFVDGLTEELIAELGQVPTLRVISRTSSMTYKDTKKTVPEIARELGVEGIVEGSVSREGERVRITTQLIDSRTDQHIWAHTYDRDTSSALDLQRDVAQAIAEEIRIELTPQQRAAFYRSQPVKPVALELYLLGIQQMNSGNPRAAVEFLRKSVAEDSNYAPAHAAMATAYGWMGEAGWMPYSEAFTQQKAEAERAIALDDSRPEPHLELGVSALNQDWDWNTQKKEFQRALELNPNASVVRWAYANYLVRIGLPNEAMEEGQRALQLDPVSSHSFMNASFLAYYSRRYDEALAFIQRAIALHPNPSETMFPLGVIYVEKKRYDEAVREFQKMGNMPHALGHMGNAYGRAGHGAEALATIPKLQEHIAKTGIGRYEIALVYAGLGQKDEAFAWLERALQARDKGMTYLLVDPCLDPLRSDARFAPLVQRVGFPGN